MSSILDQPISSPTPKNFLHVILRWEINRVIFNITLGTVGYGMFLLEYHLVGHSARYWKAYWTEAILLGVLANIAFSMAYCIEGYQKYLHHSYNSRADRSKLFIKGLLFSVLLLIGLGIWSITHFDSGN